MGFGLVFGGKWGGGWGPDSGSMTAMEFVVTELCCCRLRSRIKRDEAAEEVLQRVRQHSRSEAVPPDCENP